MLKLRDLLTEHPGDVPVTLEMHLADRTVRIATPDNLKVELVRAGHLTTYDDQRVIRNGRHVDP